MTFGGIVEFSLNQFDDKVLETMQNNRVALANGGGEPRGGRMKKPEQSAFNNSYCELLFLEDKFGVNLQVS